jgi:sulfite exporter TauE/SafE
MCGPLVAVALGSTQQQSALSRAALQVAYHGGRLVTYSLLGAVCGWLGATLDLGGNLFGVQRVAGILAGCMMVLVGIIAALRYSGLRFPKLQGPKLLEQLIVVGQRAAMGWRPFPRSLTIGLLSVLLPCGWLYLFAIAAAGSGSALWGAAVMAAFWLGTVPVLASLGVSVQMLTGKLGRRVPLATAVVVVLLGLYTLAGQMTIRADAFEQPLPGSESLDTDQRVEQIGETVPPCCRHDED